ncbi:hypothetical protein [Paenibacillus arenilitoris]|uniref:Uncharacterized protein n=1 Tax=Paenibacillus arenilitoris TaxID=2772299 RepID=A0A927CU81_9BACL|nr:hypothetical protein [Paenibacillus arenilitoris]MBD2872316.1 hypothetical protein [Paenibacillus arenilitoris]
MKESLPFGWMTYMRPGDLAERGVHGSNSLQLEKRRTAAFFRAGPALAGSPSQRPPAKAAERQEPAVGDVKSDCRLSASLFLTKGIDIDL